MCPDNKHVPNTKSIQIHQNLTETEERNNSTRTIAQLIFFKYKEYFLDVVLINLARATTRARTTALAI